MLDLNPDLKPEDIQSILRLNAFPVDAEHIPALGAGVINAEAALEYVAYNNINHFEAHTGNNVQVVDVVPAFPFELATIILEGYEQSSMPISSQAVKITGKLKKAILRVNFEEEYYDIPDVWLRYKDTSGIPISTEVVLGINYTKNIYDRYAKSVEIVGVDEQGFDVEMHIWDYQQYNSWGQAIPGYEGYYPNINGAVSISYTTTGIPSSSVTNNHTFTSSTTIGSSMYTGTTTIEPGVTVTVGDGETVLISGELNLEQQTTSGGTQYAILGSRGTLEIANDTQIEGGIIRAVRNGVSSGGTVIIGEDVSSLATRLVVERYSSMNIQPGADLQFAPNHGINVSGNFNMQGTSGKKITLRGIGAAEWGGVHFKFGPGGSTQSMSHCIVKQADTGIRADYNNTVPTIHDCTFENNNTGVAFDGISGGSPSLIRDNMFINNSIGISYQYSSRWIWGNEFTDNNRSIRIVNSPTSLYHNQFSGSSTAMTVIHSSANIIRNWASGNNTGVTAYGSGTTVVVENDIYPGGNTAINATFNATVQAAMYTNNYWGPNPSHSHFVTSYGGVINNYFPAASSPKTNFRYSEPSKPGEIIALSVESEGKADERFAFVEALYEARCDEARGLLVAQTAELNTARQDDVNRYRSRLAGLAGCYLRSGQDGFTAFLDEEVHPRFEKTSTIKATAIELESQFLVQQAGMAESYEEAVGYFEKAARNYHQLKENFSDDPLIHQNALFGLGYLHYERLESVHRGARYFRELKERYPDSELAKHVAHMYGNQIADGIERARMALAEQTPGELTLHRNYPNPYNPVTTIQFELPEQVDVRLTVYDILGRRVAVLVNEQMTAGTHTVQFDASNLASGVYIYRMTTPEFTQTRQMTVVK